MILSIFILPFFAAMSESKLEENRTKKKINFLNFILSQHIA